MSIDNIYFFVQNNALVDIYLRDEYIGELIGIYSYGDRDNEFRGFIIKINEKSFISFKEFAICLNSKIDFKTRILPNLPNVNQDTLVVYVRKLGNVCFKNKVSLNQIIEKL